MSSTLFGVGGRDMSHFLMDTPHIRIPLKVCQVFFFYFSISMFLQKPLKVFPFQSY